MGRPAEAEPDLRIGQGNIQREGPHKGTGADRQEEEDDATQEHRQTVLTSGECFLHGSQQAKDFSLPKEQCFSGWMTGWPLACGFGQCRDTPPRSSSLSCCSSFAIRSTAQRGSGHLPVQA